MDFFECVLNRRTCRKFKQDQIPQKDYDKMIDAGRYAPTGYNKQPVRFALLHSRKSIDYAFSRIGWLTGKPDDDHRPTAYIVVLIDNSIGGGYGDAACATYSVMLAAHALGYGSCWHGVGKKEEMQEFLGISKEIEPHIMISLGKPAETAIVKNPSEEWKVQKDEEGVIHLGKFSREKVLIAEI